MAHANPSTKEPNFTELSLSLKVRTRAGKALAANHIALSRIRICRQSIHSWAVAGYVAPATLTYPHHLISLSASVSSLKPSYLPFGLLPVRAQASHDCRKLLSGQNIFFPQIK